MTVTMAVVRPAHGPSPSSCSDVLAWQRVNHKVSQGTCCGLCSAELTLGLMVTPGKYY